VTSESRDRIQPFFFNFALGRNRTRDPRVPEPKRTPLGYILYIIIQSDQQETKSRVLPHLLFYRNVFLSWISRFYLLAVNTRFVGCLPLKNLLLIAFINFL
jgi:hypothetical protein